MNKKKELALGDEATVNRLSNHRQNVINKVA